MLTKEQEKIINQKALSTKKNFLIEEVLNAK
jgi:hypothetical protein